MYNQLGERWVRGLFNIMEGGGVCREEGGGNKG